MYAFNTKKVFFSLFFEKKNAFYAKCTKNDFEIIKAILSEWIEVMLSEMFENSNEKSLFGIQNYVESIQMVAMFSFNWKKSNSFEDERTFSTKRNK